MLGLLEVYDPLDVLVEFMSCINKVSLIPPGRPWPRTSVLGLRDHLRQELSKIRKVRAEEAGLKNQSLSGVVCGQLTS
jgi:hypothetical protein